MGKNYYEILGISKSASEEDIKKAYRKMALRFHPDKNKEADAEEKFKAIAEAYEVLGDKQKRDAFDLYGDKGVKGQFKKGKEDPFDLFKTFFNGSDPFSSLFGDHFDSSFHHQAHHLHHRHHTTLFSAHPIFRNRGFGSNLFNDLQNKGSSTTTSTSTSTVGDPIIIKKTVVGGDGSVRTEMRFRSTSENEASQVPSEKTFRRQQSEPETNKQQMDKEEKHSNETNKQSNSQNCESSKFSYIKIPIQRDSKDSRQSSVTSSSPPATRQCFTGQESATIIGEILEEAAGNEKNNNQVDIKIKLEESDEGEENETDETSSQTEEDNCLSSISKNIAEEIGNTSTITAETFPPATNQCFPSPAGEGSVTNMRKIPKESTKKENDSNQEDTEAQNLNHDNKDIKIKSDEQVLDEFGENEADETTSQTQKDDNSSKISKNISKEVGNIPTTMPETKEHGKEESLSKGTGVNNVDSETFVQKLKSNDNLLPKVEPGSKTETVNVPSWREYFGIGIK